MSTDALTRVLTHITGSENDRDRLEIIRHKLKFIGDKPSVLVIRDLGSLVPADGVITDLVTLAGGRPETDFTADPEILIVAPSDSAIPRTLGSLSILTGMSGWHELKAVKNKRVYIANGAQYFQQSGASLIDTAEILAEIIHPKLFIFGFEGNGWVAFG
jgi:iron complex transport system substrate-binding protein